MSRIRLLDCTLRDGGYVNEWNFGKDAIGEISRKSAEAGSEIVELGFLRDVAYNENAAVFSDIKLAREFMPQKNYGAQYAVMCEALNPLPLEKIAAREKSDVEIIRVIVWKRLLNEGLEYCRGIVERGYQLCVQPNRVDQYSDEEFVEMIRLFRELGLYAFYIVDSFGILDTESVLHYADLANENLGEEIAIGYHGHNNLMQAYGTSQELMKRGYRREIFLDASVYGVGRGAGNLNLELIAKFLNEQKECEKKYQIEKYLYIYDKYIKSLYEKEQWGYTPAYYLTALARCNPMYGQYYCGKRRLEARQIQSVLSYLSGEERIRFSINAAENAYIKYLASEKKEVCL